MKTAYFIFYKGTDKLYDDYPYFNKTAAKYGLMFGPFGTEPKGRYLKVLKQYGNTSSKNHYHTYEEPDNKEYYEKVEVDNPKKTIWYFQFQLFNKKVWEPYVKEHFEIRKVKYRISIEK